MKVLQLNSVCGMGSTGKIVVSISKELSKQGIENKILYAYGKDGHANSQKYSAALYIKVQALVSRILGNYGFNSYIATKRLIAKIAEFGPDIVHIHNIHSHDCNLKKLIGYLNRGKIKIVWTFHDCWAFTGYCTYFDMSGCGQWRTTCKNCPQKKLFSWFFDRSRTMWARKQKLLSNIGLTIITPSKWLADLTKQSFLGRNKVWVINNGIDLKVFRPTSSDFRQKYHCEDKYVIMGVSFDWDERKGLSDFIQLASRLEEKYQIVLVGTNDLIDQKLPKNIISIHRTKDTMELAQLYSAADLFVNPTKEENFPTVNIESLACGTPVLTYNTGGSPEIIDETCGCVVEKNDIVALEREIRSICEENRYSIEACVNRAQKFNYLGQFPKYVALYKSLI